MSCPSIYYFCLNWKIWDILSLGLNPDVCSGLISLFLCAIDALSLPLYKLFHTCLCKLAWSLNSPWCRGTGAQGVYTADMLRKSHRNRFRDATCLGDKACFVFCGFCEWICVPVCWQPSPVSTCWTVKFPHSLCLAHITPWWADNVKEVGSRPRSV